ncbi:hypothetical protein [Fibrella aquatica]|uniref:hypothetical protein n=1 Tax=Fibrella aquatica TaxID=3242487 RepID=UPI0035216C4F
MSVEERISELEARLADILFRYDGLIEAHTGLLASYDVLRTQHDQHRVETLQTINLLCSLVGLVPEQLTGEINLLDHPDLLRKRLANQRN